jgi:hypothetical protein
VGDQKTKILVRIWPEKTVLMRFKIGIRILFQIGIETIYGKKEE